MADETDVMGEVARVLLLHPSFKASSEIQTPNAPWWWECDGVGCGRSISPSGHGRDTVLAMLAAHQAAMLAEAGLLRDGRQADGGWDRVLRLASELNIAAHEASQTAQQAQIATQVPAGEPVAPSGGLIASGGLGERLRAAADYQDRPGAYDELRALADEADVLEAAYRVADAEIARLGEFHDHYRAQVEAIRAAITREAAHGDAITRCNLAAERFQTVLDSVSAP